MKKGLQEISTTSSSQLHKLIFKYQNETIEAIGWNDKQNLKVFKLEENEAIVGIYGTSGDE